MQVVSGPAGRERVHCQAPAAARLDRAMRAFLAWFNDAGGADPVLKAGIAHLDDVSLPASPSASRKRIQLATAARRNE